MELTNDNIQIYSCQFQIYVEKANVQIKFPCNYFLEWKANNGKVLVSSRNRYQANKSQIIFKESLAINLNILYDKLNQKYIRKQSILMINLESKSRPDQIKLVGRTTIDLAEVLNQKRFSQIATTQLQYCSVQASINFSINKATIKQSTIPVSQLDRSSYSQYMTFNAALRPHQQLVLRNQGSNKLRDFGQLKSQTTQKSQQERQNKSLSRGKNKMSTKSLTKQVHPQINRVISTSQTAVVLGQSKAGSSKVIQRSNSIQTQPQNQKKLMSPQSLQQSQENQSNFSFHKHTDSQQQSNTPTDDYSEAFKIMEQNQKYMNDAIKPLNFTNKNSKILQNQIIKKHATDTAALNAQRMKQYKTGIQGLEVKSQNNGTKLEQISNHLREKNQSMIQGGMSKNIGQKARTYNNLQESGEQNKEQGRSSQDKIKQSQQLIIKIREYQITINQKDETIRSLRTQIQSLRRVTATNKLSNQMQKYKQQGKRILSLTQALSQFQNKYTKATLQTQQLKNNWRKQKEHLLKVISLRENVLGIRETQMQQISKLNQELKNDLMMLQKQKSQKQGQVIRLRNQTANVQTYNLQLTSQKSKMHHEISRLQSQIKFLNQLNSQNHNQLNQTFSKRLNTYKSQINVLQARIQWLKKQKEQLIMEVDLLKLRKEQGDERIRIFQEQFLMLNSQLQGAQREMFRLSEEKEQIRLQLQKENKQIRQTAFKISQSKSQEMERYLQQKQSQFSMLKQQRQAQVRRVQQQREKQKEVYKNTEKQLIIKTQNLENTLLRLSDQISEYQVQLKRSSQKLQYSTLQLNSFKQNQQSISKLAQQEQRQRQQLLLSLNSRLEQQSLVIQNNYNQIYRINGIIAQKDDQLTKHRQQLQSIESQLQITKARIQIYERKINQLQLHYWQQAENLKLQQAQSAYEVQSQLQQQLQRNRELQQIKEMLRSSLQDWQGKCTNDKISSSKAIGILNDMIKQKQEVMSQMQSIMKDLQKDRNEMQQKMATRYIQHQEMVCYFRSKQAQVRRSIQDQQQQFLALYQEVRDQRRQSNQKMSEQRQTIEQLQSQMQQQGTKMHQLANTLQKTRISLQSSQHSLVHFQSRSQHMLQTMTSEHNQQLQEYQERVRQLQSILGHKNQEILQKQIMVFDLEKQRQSLAQQLQIKIKWIQNLQQLKSQNTHQVQAMQNNKIDLQNQLENLSKNLEDQVQEYIQLQMALIESENHFNQKVQNNQNQKNQLISKIQTLQSQLNEKAKEHKQNEDSYNLTIQNIKVLNSQQVQKLRNEQIVKQQQLMAKINTLQEQLIRQDELIVQKQTNMEKIYLEKLEVQNCLSELRYQRETFALLDYAQQTQKFKSQIKCLQKQSLQLKSQLSKVPSLERTIKIKTIQLNSLKYKSSTNCSHSVESGQSYFQQILKLKDQEIQAIKTDNQRLKELQLQLFQAQSLNSDLQQEIQKYEEYKFNLNSEHNQKDIRIVELQEQIQDLSQAKNQLKQKHLSVADKLKYYENLILDFKGHQISSTHSQRMINSRISSVDIIKEQIQSAQKVQVQTLRKKMKFVETQIQWLKKKQEEFVTKQKKMESKINELQEIIAQKQLELVKWTSNVAAKLSLSLQKQKTQYKNPRHTTQIFKQIQGILKKRNEFHNLQKTLITVMNTNANITEQIQQAYQQQKELKQVIPKLSAHMNTLSKQLQIIKVRIMKLEGMNYQQKAKLISMLKPCEQGIKQVAKLTENKNEF